MNESINHCDFFNGHQVKIGSHF